MQSGYDRDERQGCHEAGEDDDRARVHQTCSAHKKECDEIETTPPLVQIDNKQDCAGNCDASSDDLLRLKGFP